MTMIFYYENPYTCKDNVVLKQGPDFATHFFQQPRLGTTLWHAWGSFFWHTWISACTSNYIHYKVYEKITYPFPNFNGYTVEVWEGMSNFIPHFTGHVFTYPCWALS